MTHYVVSSGVTSSGLTISGGSSLSVRSGGTASAITMLRNSTENVLAGGSAVDTTVSGGNQYVYGTASGTTLEGAYAEQIVQSGGVASDVVVKALGEQLVSGTTDGVVVSLGGIERIYNGGEASDVVLSGGLETVFSGGAVSGVLDEGLQVLSSGAHATDIVVSNGVEQVLRGSVVSGVTVAAGGVVIDINNAPISGLTVQSGGVVLHDYIVNSGKTSSGLVISSGAYVQVNSGGAIVSATLERGAEGLISGGRAIDTRVQSGASETVLLGGVDSGATLLAYGVQEIVSGAAFHDVISSGGLQLVEYGGRAVHDTVASGGVVQVDDNGLLNGATVLSGGELRIDPGHGSVGGLALRAGSTIDLTLQSATSARVQSGDLQVLDGTKVVDSFSLSTPATSLTYTVSSDGHGGTDVHVEAAKHGEQAANSGVGVGAPTGGRETLVQAAAGFATANAGWTAPTSLVGGRADGLFGAISTAAHRLA